MQTIWCSPIKHFGESENIIAFKETKDSALRKIFLLAVDEVGNIVVGMKLKSWKK